MTETERATQRILARREYYRRNFRAFAKEQVKIRPLGGGAVVPLLLTESQELFLRRTEIQQQTQGYVRGVVLKPRQSGFSTMCQALAFWRTYLNPNTSSLLVAADTKSTEAIFRMALLMLDCLDDEIRTMVRWLNRQELDFSNPDKYTRGRNPGLGSRMEFQTAKHGIVGTGTTRQFIHASEVGKWEENLTDDLATSLMPAIQRLPGTYIIMESTAFEGGDYFREMCEEAEDAEIKRSKGDVGAGGSEWFFHFTPWWVDKHKNSVPLLPGEEMDLDAQEKDLQKYAQKGFPKEYPHLGVGSQTITPEQFNFRRKEIVALKGEKNWDQEYPMSPRAAWITRDRYAFDRKALMSLRKQLSAPKEYVSIDNGPRLLTLRKHGNVMEDDDYIAVWKRPEPGVTYDIGVDSAQGGRQGDWTHWVVLRRDNCEQVAEYHKHIEPMDCAKELYWMGRIYNTAHLIIEMNIGPGSVVHHEIDMMGYPYLYTWRNFDRIGQALTTYAGWATNHKSKKLMVAVSADKVAHEDSIIKSRVLWQQMWLYVNIGSEEYQAARGYDDGVMAYMMAVIGGKHEGHVDPGEHIAQPKEEIRWPALHDTRPNVIERTKHHLLNRELAEMRGMR